MAFSAHSAALPTVPAWGTSPPGVSVPVSDQLTVTPPASIRLWWEVANPAGTTVTVRFKGWIQRGADNAVELVVSDQSLPANSDTWYSRTVTVPSGTPAGTYDVILSVEYPSGSTVDQRRLTGRLVVPAPVCISATPSTLAFGNVLVGQISTQTLTISDPCAGALAVSSISSSNPRFTVSATSLDVAAGGSQTIAVTFAPTSTGAQNSTLTITSNASGQSSLTVNLTGTGVVLTVPGWGSALPEVSLPVPDQLTVTPPDSIRLWWEVANPAGATATVRFKGWIQRGADNAVELVVSDQSLPANSDTWYSRTVTVPSGTPAGTYDVILSVEYPSGSTIDQRRLAGRLVVSVPPCIIATPSTLAFGSVLVGQTSTQSLTISDPCAGALAVSSISSSSPRFTVSATSLDVAAGGSQTIAVTFAPTSTGAQSGTLTITSNAPGQSMVRVPLVGTADPRGSVTMDFDLNDGDQGKRTLQGAVAGARYTVQICVDSAPAIKGWSAVVEFDSLQARYVPNSFAPTAFIPGLVPLVEEKPGQVAVGGTVLGAAGTGSGSGTLAAIVFQLAPGFTDSTHLLITKMSYNRAFGGEQVYEVRSVAALIQGGCGQADFNGDGTVDFSDFFLFADAFGSSDPMFDLNCDGEVGFSDFFLFADEFGGSSRAKLFSLAHQYLHLPYGPGLQPSCPNPFNSATEIRYTVDEPAAVQLVIYSPLGQAVRVLAQGQHERGTYRAVWDGTDEQGQVVASGLYICRYVVQGMSFTRKLALVK